MVCNTQKGLYFLIIGSIITIICSFITSITYLLAYNTIMSIVIAGFGFISFIGAILILIGLILFLMGRKEFGEKHQNNVKNAVIIFCINIIVAIILVVIVAFMAFSAITTSLATSSTVNMPSSVTLSTVNISGLFSIVIIIISVISAVLGGLMYYFGLIELENKTGKNILFAGIISSIIISIVTSFYVVGMLGEIFGSLSSTSNYPYPYLNQNVGGIGILAIIPNLLFLYAFYIPYNRIKNGELIPKTFPSGQSQIPSRICPNCGRPIPMDAQVCPYCGKDFRLQ